MFKKIKFGSTLAALIIFAFPWVEMQCSGRVMVTQSGFQVIHGSGSVSEEMEAMEGDPSSTESVSGKNCWGPLRWWR